MRIAKLLLGASCALFSLTALADNSATAADIARATQEATKLANQLRNTSAVREADGSVTLDESGRAKTTNRSTVTTAGDLEYFKSVTGIEGLEQVSSPGKSGKTGLVNVTSAQNFDMNCKAPNPGGILAAGGIAFKVEQCVGTPVSSIKFSICTEQANASLCATAEDFKQRIEVPNGSYVTVGSAQVGAGCNSVDTCRITVRKRESIGGNNETLGQQAAAKSANSGIVQGLQQPVSSGEYAQKMNEVGKPLVACSEKNRNSMGANGTVSGCEEDGQGATVTVRPGLNQDNASCTSQRECLRWGTTSQSFTRTCTRTFPLTVRVTNYEYDTQVCSYRQAPNETGAMEVVNSCSAETMERMKKDFNLISTDKRTCENGGPVDDLCGVILWTENYAAKEARIVGQADSPSPVAGACDTNPLSETTMTGYDDPKGTWFGRTLEDNECLTEIVDDDGEIVPYWMSNAEKKGCGIFTRPSVGNTCYGQPSAQDDLDSCANVQLNGCRLVSSSPNAYTGGNTGLVMSQTESYDCGAEQRTCLEWSAGQGDNACLSTSEMTMGMDKQKTVMNDGSAMNNAIVAAAILDATAEAVDNDQDPEVPLLFGGKDERCRRATGGIGSLFGRNCCRMDLERPISGQLMRKGCTLEHAKLAAARRSHYTVYIGDYCSKKMKFPSKCLERTETYCVFGGILPRLIHEQGRVQLGQMAASSIGADVVRSNYSFGYLHSGNGAWAAPQTVNGVTVAAWQWPSYCANPELAAERIANDPTAYECPGIVHTVFASCDTAGGCGNLPPAPEYGSGEWNIIDVNPLEDNTTAISRYAVVTGACSTSNSTCQYEVASWPVGQGGRAVITRDLGWELYSDVEATQQAGSGVSQMTNMADIMFRTWSAPGLSDGKTVPDTVRVDFSKDGGQSWTTHAVPTNLRGTQFTFPGSDTKLTGSCDALTNLCTYRATGTLVIMAKPWGSAKRPDCTGFTPGQLSAMDFGKMDLSEWLATVMDKVSSAQPSDLAKAASQQFQDFNSLFTGGQGTVVMKAPAQANFARITPSQGFGPFETTLVVSSFWPQTTGDPSVDTNSISQVKVDWGDCTPTTMLERIDPYQKNSGFRGVHVFDQPDKLRCGAKKGNVTHVIKITAYTRSSGIKEATVSVENAWATFPGGNGGMNAQVPIEVSRPVNSNVPTPPNAQN